MIIFFYFWKVLFTFDSDFSLTYDNIGRRKMINNMFSLIFNETRNYSLSIKRNFADFFSFT